MKIQRIDKNKILKLRERYDVLVNQMNILSNTYAISYWKIIKEASDIGLEIFGVSFSHQKLADDFGIGRKSVGRCLALAQMNNKTEGLVKSGKIAASKIVPILITKNFEYQDLIIKRIMEEGITYEQIQRNLPLFSNKEEIKDWNFKSPVIKLNKQEHTIISHFFKKITEFTFLLTVDTSNLGDVKELSNRIKELQERLDFFVRKINGFEDDDSLDSIDDIEDIL